jgi:hypothetical protein
VPYLNYSKESKRKEQVFRTLKNKTKNALEVKQRKAVSRWQVVDGKNPKY